MFKFINRVTEVDEYYEQVKRTWDNMVRGKKQNTLWFKLMRLQATIRNMSRPFVGIKEQIDKARGELEAVQKNIVHDKMNAYLTKEEKNKSERMLELLAIEEHVMRQRAKVKWIRLGDGNNAYFHASLKSKHSNMRIHRLCKADGAEITGQDETTEEVLHFYGNLMGSTQKNLQVVDIMVLRKGKQLSKDQRTGLIKEVTENEIVKALDSIGDLKAPGVDGYNSKFFKSSWNIVKEDVNVVNDFFEKGVLDRKWNLILISLILKQVVAKSIKEYRPIACCTTVYKIIAKVIAIRISAILPSIISKNQVAFVPSQNIHDHILLAYDLVKGYNIRGGIPRRMIQMDCKRLMTLWIGKL